MGCITCVDQQFLPATRTCMVLDQQNQMHGKFLPNTCKSQMYNTGEAVCARGCSKLVKVAWSTILCRVLARFATATQQRDG